MKSALMNDAVPGGSSVLIAPRFASVSRSHLVNTKRHVCRGNLCMVPSYEGNDQVYVGHIYDFF